MLKKKILTFAAAAVLSLGALPALADSVNFGFSVGGRHGGGGHGGYGGGYSAGHGGYRGGHGGYSSGWNNHGYYRSHYRPAYYGPRFYQPAYYPAPYYSSTRVVYVDQPPAYIEDEPIVANKGRVVSTNPYCREYQRTVNVGGRTQQSYGTACRQPDGAWKIVSSD